MRTLKLMTAGFNTLAADLYWIRTIQYYGRTKLKTRDVAVAPGPDTDYHLLYPLLDLTTTLDPRFNIAYRFGSIFLAETYPGGPGRPDLAVALLEKGLRERPDKWEYMQDIGFVHYWWTHDFKAASDWFNRAADVPGAPWFLRSLAATTLAEGGDRRSSRVMWEAIRESAEIAARTIRAQNWSIAFARSDRSVYAGRGDRAPGRWNSHRLGATHSRRRHSQRAARQHAAPLNSASALGHHCIKECSSIRPVEPQRICWRTARMINAARSSLPSWVPWSGASSTSIYRLVGNRSSGAWPAPAAAACSRGRDSTDRDWTSARPLPGFAKPFPAAIRSSNRRRR